MENSNSSLALMIEKSPIIEQAFASIDVMEKFCEKVLESRLAPDHFYPKLTGANERDYTKGNKAAVMMVLLQGRQLNLPGLTALQQIVPVNGLLSIKGDAAKSMILSSGKVKQGTWKEVITGSIAEGNYTVSITATRVDTLETLTRSFSVEQAKRAGLWVTEEMIRGTDGWKWKKSAWYKYPERMIAYRALGFIARDLFPDVMSGIYTTEEAIDMPVDQTVSIETASGAKAIIPDSAFAQDRAKSLTQKAANLIDKKQNQLIEEAVIIPETAVHNNKKEEELPKSQLDEELYNEGELKLMPVEKLIEICNAVPEMEQVFAVLPGKNTNKKLRDIILTFQEGGIDLLIDKYGDVIDKAELSNTDYNQGIEPPEENTEEEKEQEESDIQEKEDLRTAIPKLHFEIPELNVETNCRDFADTAKLYGALNTVFPAISDNRFLKLSASDKKLDGYPDKESFCKKAPIDDVMYLIKINSSL